MRRNNCLRAKAVKLRENGHTLTEICNHLQVSKSTAWYWIKDVEMKKPNAFLGKTSRASKEAAFKAAQAHKQKRLAIHEDYASSARERWSSELRESGEFRLFLMLYMAEGIRKDRSSFGISNSDPDIISFAYKMMTRINIHEKLMRIDVQLTETFDSSMAVTFWKDLLGAENKIHITLRRQYGDLSGRNWVSRNGIVRLRIYDTYVKTMVDEWIGLFRREVLAVIT